MSLEIKSHDSGAANHNGTQKEMMNLRKSVLELARKQEILEEKIDSLISGLSIKPD